jgi:ABC-type glycerol-3-phosphate transport system substrate-binding protein
MICRPLQTLLLGLSSMIGVAGCGGDSDPAPTKSVQSVQIWHATSQATIGEI